MKIAQIEASPLSVGKRYLLAHMTGKKLTARQAVLAKCTECMNGWHDGRVDCRIPDCPLYPWQPYKNSQSLPVA